MNQLIVAAPSDTIPASGVINGNAYQVLTFDFAIALDVGETIATATLRFSNSLATLITTSTTDTTAKFLILTAMADGQEIACSCSILTSTGHGNARTIRLVAYDSGVGIGTAPVNPFLISASYLITPGLVNDICTIALAPVVLTGASIGGPCEVSTRDPMPGFVKTGEITTAGQVTISILNDSGVNTTLPENLYTVTSFLI